MGELKSTAGVSIVSGILESQATGLFSQMDTVHNRGMKASRTYKDLIWQDPDRVSGAICFFGTRLPVQHMFDHLESGYRLEEFCEAFDLNLQQAKAVLDLAAEGFDRLLSEAA